MAINCEHAATIPDKHFQNSRLCESIHCVVCTKGAAKVDIVNVSHFVFFKVCPPDQLHGCSRAAVTSNKALLTKVNTLTDSRVRYTHVCSQTLT
jgi:hypothetical protein